jgi:Protein of unknown function (DUF1573)
MARFLAAVMAVAALACGSFAAAPDYFTEKEKDFGVTAVGPVLIHYFSIKNTSNQTVTMGTPRIQCGCVSVTLMKGQLAAGETTYLVAYMNTAKIPANQIGTNKSVNVSVPFLTPTFEEVNLKVSALARPDMVWSANDGVSFGTVTRGKASKASMKVTLFGNPKWEISGIKSSGIYIKPEVKVVARTNSEVTYEVIGTLDEKCPMGNWMSDLTVETNAPGIKAMRIPVTVNVVSAISVSPESVKLGALATGDSKTMDVMVNGLQPFKVLEVKGGDDTVSVRPMTEGARHQHTLKVDIKSTGDLKREIQILTDSKDMPTVVLPVTYTVKK